MKNLLPGILFLLAFQAFSSFAQYPNFEGQRYDSILFKSWENGAWVKETKLSNTYNADCNNNSTTAKSWVDNAWEYGALTTYTYLPSKKVYQSFASAWNGATWLLVARTTIFYNQALQLTRELNEYNPGTGWQSQSQNTYTYDVNGYLAREVGEKFKGIQFENSTRTDYTNTSGGMVNSERSQSWSLNTWVNEDSTSYAYNGNNQIVSSISFDWITNKWVNAEKNTSTYVNNLLTEVINQEWINNAWVNSEKTTLIYDGKKRVLSILNQVWEVPGQKWENSDLSEFSYTTACSALPLTLLQFSVELNKGEVWLQWETANEVNTFSFDIERSPDGVHFDFIGSRTASGGKTHNEYAYTDLLENTQPGVFYYRLKMLDRDGEYAFSTVVKVNVDRRESLSLFPNPVTNELRIVLPVNMRQAEVSIQDQAGRILLHKKIEGVTRDSYNKITVSFLPAGVYVCKIAGDNYIIRRSFVKH